MAVENPCEKHVSFCIYETLTLIRAKENKVSLPEWMRALEMSDMDGAAEASPFGMAAMGAFSLPGPRPVSDPSRAPTAAPVAAETVVAGMDAALDPTGALYWRAERTLIVSDLHLETGSSYARTGQMLPPYDTGLTLSKLEDAVARYRPARIVSLGDSFHDPFGVERLSAETRTRLARLIDAMEMVWVCGNHEKDSAGALGGSVHEVWRCGGIDFRHIPTDGVPDAPEVAGHLHPAARIVIRGRSLRRRCFIGCDRRLVMPAFGSYTGGLSVTDPAFAALWPQGPGPRIHMIGQARVYSV